MLSSTFRRALGGSACAAALGLAVACGGPPAPAAPTVVSPAAAPSAAAGHSAHGMDMGEGDGVQLYAVQSGPLGVVTTDGQGRLLYGSVKDANNPPTSRCAQECAQEWMPLVVPAGEEPELLGVSADKVGRLPRDDGSSQVTLGGWPMYVNMNDDGQLTGPAPDAHGAWFVMTPEGQKKAV